MQENSTRRDKRIDKIMRKNLEHPSAELLSFFLSEEVISTSTLPPRTSQLVFEQEPDTLLLVQMKGKQRFIFHLEFQSTNDHRMADRMACYDYMLRLKHNMDVVSAVIYTGNEPMTMKNFIRQRNSYYEYQLIDIRDMDPELFLRSEKPAEVMLAILTGRECERKGKMIRQILIRLQEKLSASASLLDEQVGIFKILGAIRGNDIQEQIIKEEQHMPIMYDLNKVFFYQQAMEEGIEKGIEIVIRQMLKAGVPVSTIQTYTDVSKEKVQQIADKLSSGN